MIHVSSLQFFGREEEYVLDCLETRELSSIGKYVSRLEFDFSSYCGTNRAVACCNGTAALHLALLTLGIGPGDLVFLPALTYVATANAVTYCGATPIFCEVDPKTWCLDVHDVEEKLKQRHSSAYKSVIMPVHLYGVMADMPKFRILASRYKSFLVEDAAEAHGAHIDGIKAGNWGDLGIFSFYGNKIITCGEGGIVTTNSYNYYNTLKLYRGQGMTNRYFHEVVGYNYRMTNIQAAIAVGQLETINEHLRIRAQVEEWYDLYLPDDITRQYRPRGSVNWMYSVLVPPDVDRNDVMLYLEKVHNIETRPVFVPMTELPIYKDITPSITKDIASRGINLPTHSNLTFEEVKTICSAFSMAVSGAYRERSA